MPVVVVAVGTAFVTNNKQQTELPFDSMAARLHTGCEQLLLVRRSDVTWKAESQERLVVFPLGSRSSLRANRLLYLLLAPSSRHVSLRISDSVVLMSSLRFDDSL